MNAIGTVATCLRFVCVLEFGKAFSRFGRNDKNKRQPTSGIVPTVDSQDCKSTNHNGKLVSLSDLSCPKLLFGEVGCLS